MRIRLVSLNAGLLSLFGGQLQLVPFVEERLKALPERLSSLDADIVNLQEVYRQRHREFLISELRSIYPYSAYGRKRQNFGLENGLMVLSKYPLSSVLKLFRDAPIDEALFDNKGALLCRVELTKNENLGLVNIHTTAGGFWIHPEAPKANHIRERQIREILSVGKDGPGASLIVGDLNAGPGVSEVNLQQILDAGYESVYDRMHPDRMVPGLTPESTWDPLNQLNTGSPHRACPPQRIDHVLVRKSDLGSGTVIPLDCEICLREEVVPVPGGSRVTVSDHFALRVDLEYRQSQSQPQS